jgi:predicted transcriptional regulator
MRRAVVNSRPTITFFDTNIALLVYKTYKESLEKGKEMNVIFEKNSFDYHIKVIKKLGRRFAADWKKSVLDQFEHYNIKAYVIDEYLPMQMDINERRVNLSLRHHDIINGIVIQGSDIVELYNKVFNQHLKRARSVIPLIKEF